MRERDLIEQDDAIRSKMFSGDKTKMRNLRQYKKLSDEEFDDVYAKKQVGVEMSKDFEDRINKKIESFAKDYDIDDLNSNDMLILRALAQALLSLEDYESITYKRRMEGIDLNNLIILEKLDKIKSDLRGDISKMQDDLKITRRVRKSDKEASVVTYIEDLKKKAREFYKSRMLYVFCPKCNMLLGTVWSLYPDNDRNRVSFACSRVMDNGEECGEKVTISTRELIKMGGSNKPELLTEAMK